MEVLYNKGIQFILELQASFIGWDKEMLFLSRVGDPKNAFLIYFPFVFHLDGSLGLGVLWTAIISEWLNLILKWILRGERPYWWIHETTKWKNVTLHQYELTCETGPGSPSGHAMVTSAVLFLLVPPLISLLKRKLLHRAQKIYNVIGTMTIWSLFLMVLCLVSLSRVFIATHFPHQVLLGTAVGAIVAYAVQKRKLMQDTVSGSLLYSCLLSVALGTVTLLSYKILSVAVYNPSVSVEKAQKWCVNPSYIHLDTTPFYALVRDTGAALGIGIALSLAKFIFKVKCFSVNGFYGFHRVNSFLVRILNAFLSIIILQLLEIIALPKSSPFLFYVLGYVKSTLIPIIVVFAVPAAMCSLDRVIFKNSNKHFD